ncbi:MAG: alpha-amylase family glycosyl hydrolase, partial [candidate division KSB1 bacterium]|nr:alpha-amylase family glycosyl hydrolase [candidate division KSB1 bacterium]
FRNGDPHNDPTKEQVLADRANDWQIHPWTSDWYKLQPWEAIRGQDFYTLVWDRRYGGDLIGVIEKLDYLQALGVEVIYFNPIFAAPSLHKYDAITYHHIDNSFGPDRDGDWAAIQSEKEDPATWTFTQADRTFLELIRRAHQRGIKIVIDGVFNHSGSEFWAFKDIKEHQQNSAYKDWFDVVRWDDPATPDTNEFDYRAWWGFKHHPEFKEDENGLTPAVKKYFFDITRRWMDPNGDGDPSDGVDGWRLDVAADVSTKFWEEWYQLVKSINPQAYTTGEIWEEAAEWIARKRFDAVMNYPLAYAMIDFFVDKQTKISVSEFDRRLERLRNLYPEETNHILMNLIDSHDTDRIASMIKNPDRDYNQKAGVRDNPHYDPRKPKAAEKNIQKLLAIFQLTYVGAPMLYYGDEAGMWGGHDPDCRKPMLWQEWVYENETYATVRPDLKDADENKFDPDLFHHYKKLIRIRKENPAIRRGTFATTLIDDDKGLYAYLRKHDNNEVLVILNNSDAKQTIKVPAPWANNTNVADQLNETHYQVKKGKIALALDKKWGAILVKK